MKMLVLLAVLVCGCGGGSTADPLEGDWLLPTNTGAIGMSFSAGTEYQFIVLELTGAATANVQTELGTYDATGGRLSFVPKRSSCPGPAPAWGVGYRIDGQFLRLLDPSGTLSLQQDNSPATSGAVDTFGCFDSAGTFTAAPIAPVAN